MFPQEKTRLIETSLGNPTCVISEGLAQGWAGCLLPQEMRDTNSCPPGLAGCKMIQSVTVIWTQSIKSQAKYKKLS